MRRPYTLLIGFALVVSTSAQVPNYVPTNGLVGWWPFNGDNDDESGSGNTLSAPLATLTIDRFGYANSAYNFQPGQAMTKSSPLTTGVNFTYSHWVRRITNSAQENSGLGEIDVQSISGGGISTTGMTPQFICQGVSVNVTNSAYTMSVAQWYHLVVTKNGNVFTIYVNGSLDSQGSSGYLPFVASTFFEISGVNCDMDDVGIWNRALTQSEISALFNAPPPTPCISSTPVSYTGLGTSYTVNDAPVTLTGSPAGGVFIGPGVTGSSFDPAAAGVGTHSITYTYVDGNNCINTAGQCTEVALNTTTGGTHMAETGVHIFPNPTNGLFNVELDLQGLVSLQVFDAAGRLAHSEVFQGNGTRSVRTLNLVGMAKGGYTVQVQNNGGTVTQKVVIE